MTLVIDMDMTTTVDVDIDSETDKDKAKNGDKDMTMNKVMDMNMDTGTDINIDMDKGMGTRRELSDYLSIDFRTKFCPTCSMLLSFPNSERQQALERYFHCGAAEVRDFPLFLLHSLLLLLELVFPLYLFQTMKAGIEMSS
jgi:hypothetical protein